MKRCNKCKQLKSLDDYYIDRDKSDSRKTFCKNCERLAYRNRRLCNPMPYKMRDIRYRENHKVKLAIKAKERYRKYAYKVAARNEVKKALLSGELIKSTFCELCRKEVYLEAHHPDYSKPLDIQWLCRYCHRRLDFGK